MEPTRRERNSNNSEDVTKPVMTYKSWGLLVLSLIGGVGCSFVVKMLFIAPKAEKAPDNPSAAVCVLVAKTDLSAGSEMTPQNIRFARYTEEKVPQDAISRYSGLENRKLIRSITKNQPITLFDIEILDETGDQDLLFVPPGYSVVPIRVDGVTNGGGFSDLSRLIKLEELLLPGDKVALSVVQEEFQKDKQLRTVSALKLATKSLVEGADIYQVTTETSPGSGDSLRKTSIVSVLLSPDSAALVENAAKGGRLRLTILDNKGEGTGKGMEKNSLQISEVYRPLALPALEQPRLSNPPLPLKLPSLEKMEEPVRTARSNEGEPLTSSTVQENKALPGDQVRPAVTVPRSQNIVFSK